MGRFEVKVFYYPNIISECVYDVVLVKPLKKNNNSNSRREYKFVKKQNNL